MADANHTILTVTTMRMIVDSNYLNDPALATYLASSPANIVALCDYAAIEAYKAQPSLESMVASMAILADFPNQVIVLKRSATIQKLKLSADGNQRRMIDASRTKDFPHFCRQLMAAKDGSDFYAAQVRNHGIDAAKYADESLEAAGEIHEFVCGLATGFTDNQLAQFRDSQTWSDDLFIKVKGHLLEMAVEIHSTASIDIQKLRYSLTFRYVMCCYLMALRWISNGKPPKNPAKVRNHVFDCGFAAYATFFDGFLSCDREALITYKQAVSMLKRFDQS